MHFWFASFAYWFLCFYNRSEKQCFGRSFDDSCSFVTWFFFRVFGDAYGCLEEVKTVKSWGL